ncbi:MAG: hypothetical protein CML12_03795, partial [Puniceicoccaceae bacterium]|nr:hypothetical protein [Puniceicoccaceae bacterium]
MKFLNLNILKLKDSKCLIPSLSARLRSARLGRLRSNRHHPSSLRPSSLGLITLIGLTSLSSVLSAATVDDLTFTLINEGTEYAVTDCADTATGTLTIPVSYEGKPVTEIGVNAFYDAELTAIELPASLRTIRNDAFAGALIESIDLPAGLTELGDSAFSYCLSLTGSVTIPSGITEISGHLF